jgi:hypothetical protein
VIPAAPIPAQQFVEQLGFELIADRIAVFFAE